MKRSRAFNGKVLGVLIVTSMFIACSSIANAQIVPTAGAGTTTTPVASDLEINSSKSYNNIGINTFDNFQVNSAAYNNVNFNFPVGTTLLVNRVFGANPIDIDTTINGIVSGSVGGTMLFASQNGINLGASAQINVGALILTTAENINATTNMGPVVNLMTPGDPDAFMAGSLGIDPTFPLDLITTGAVGTNHQIINNGVINVEGTNTFNNMPASAALFSQRVQNNGTIRTHDGTNPVEEGGISLVAGGTADCYQTGTMDLLIPTNPIDFMPQIANTGEVVNAGSIIANGGKIELIADSWENMTMTTNPSAIFNSGSIIAGSLNDNSPTGTIMLKTYHESSTEGNNNHIDISPTGTISNISRNDEFSPNPPGFISLKTDNLNMPAGSTLNVSGSDATRQSGTISIGPSPDGLSQINFSTTPDVNSLNIQDTIFDRIDNSISLFAPRVQFESFTTNTINIDNFNITRQGLEVEMIAFDSITLGNGFTLNTVSPLTLRTTNLPSNITLDGNLIATLDNFGNYQKHLSIETYDLFFNATGGNTYAIDSTLTKPTLKLKANNIISLGLNTIRNRDTGTSEGGNLIIEPFENNINVAVLPDRVEWNGGTTQVFFDDLDMGTGLATLYISDPQDNVFAGQIGVNGVPSPTVPYFSNGTFIFKTDFNGAGDAITVQNCDFDAGNQAVIVQANAASPFTNIWLNNNNNFVDLSFQAPANVGVIIQDSENGIYIGPIAGMPFNTDVGAGYANFSTLGGSNGTIDISGYFDLLEIANTSAGPNDINIINYNGNTTLSLLANLSGRNINFENYSSGPSNTTISGNIFSIDGLVQVLQYNTGTINIDPNGSILVNGSDPNAGVNIYSDGIAQISGPVTVSLDTTTLGTQQLQIAAPTIIIDKTANPSIDANSTAGANPIPIILKADTFNILPGAAIPPLISGSLSSGDHGVLIVDRFSPGNMTVNNLGIDFDGGLNDLFFADINLGNGFAEFSIGDPYLPNNSVNQILLTNSPDNIWNSFDNGVISLASNYNGAGNAITIANADFAANNQSVILQAANTFGSAVSAMIGNSFQNVTINTTGTAALEDNSGLINVNNGFPTIFSNPVDVATLNISTALGSNGNITINGLIGELFASADGTGSLNVFSQDNIILRDINTFSGDINVFSDNGIEVAVGSNVQGHNIDIQNNIAATQDIVVNGSIISTDGIITIYQNSPTQTLQTTNGSIIRTTGTANPLYIELISANLTNLGGLIDVQADTTVPNQYGINIESPIINFNPAASPQLQAIGTSGTMAPGISFVTDQISNGTFAFIPTLITSRNAASDSGTLYINRMTPGGVSINSTGIDIDGGGNDLAFDNMDLGSFGANMLIGDEFAPANNVGIININGAPNNSFNSFNSGSLKFLSNFAGIGDAIIVNNSDFETNGQDVMFEAPDIAPAAPYGIDADGNNNFNLVSVMTPGTASLDDTANGLTLDSMTVLPSRPFASNLDVNTLQVDTNLGSNGDITANGQFAEFSANSDGSGNINASSTTDLTLFNINSNTGNVDIFTNSGLTVDGGSIVQGSSIYLHNAPGSLADININGSVISNNSNILIEQTDPLQALNTSNTSVIFSTGAGPNVNIELTSANTIFLSGITEVQADTTTFNNQGIFLSSPIITFDIANNPELRAYGTGGTLAPWVQIKADQINNATFGFAAPLVTSQNNTGNNGTLIVDRFTPGTIDIDSAGIDVDGFGNDLAFDNTNLGSFGANLSIGDDNIPSNNTLFINTFGAPSNSYNSFNNGTIQLIANFNSLSDAITLNNTDFETNNQTAILKTPFIPLASSQGINGSNNNNFGMVGFQSPGTVIIDDIANGITINDIPTTPTRPFSAISNINTLDVTTTLGSNGNVFANGNFTELIIEADGTGNINVYSPTDLTLLDVNSYDGITDISTGGALLVPFGSNVQGTNIYLHNDITATGDINIDGNVTSNNNTITIEQNTASQMLIISNNGNVRSTGNSNNVKIDLISFGDLFLSGTAEVQADMSIPAGQGIYINSPSLTFDTLSNPAFIAQGTAGTLAPVIQIKADQINSGTFGFASPIIRSQNSTNDSGILIIDRQTPGNVNIDSIGIDNNGGGNDLAFDNIDLGLFGANLSIGDPVILNSNTLGINVTGAPDNIFGSFNNATIQLISRFNGPSHSVTIANSNFETNNQEVIINTPDIIAGSAFGIGATINNNFNLLSINTPGTAIIVDNSNGIIFDSTIISPTKPFNNTLNVDSLDVTTELASNGTITIAGTVNQLTANSDGAGDIIINSPTSIVLQDINANSGIVDAFADNQIEVKAGNTVQGQLVFIHNNPTSPGNINIDGTIISNNDRLEIQQNNPGFTLNTSATSSIEVYGNSLNQTAQLRSQGGLNIGGNIEVYADTTNPIGQYGILFNSPFINFINTPSILTEATIGSFAPELHVYTDQIFNGAAPTLTSRNAIGTRGTLIIDRFSSGPIALNSTGVDFDGGGNDFFFNNVDLGTTGGNLSIGGINNNINTITANGAPNNTSGNFDNGFVQLRSDYNAAGNAVIITNSDYASTGQTLIVKANNVPFSSANGIDATTNNDFNLLSLQTPGTARVSDNNGGIVIDDVPQNPSPFGCTVNVNTLEVSTAPASNGSININGNFVEVSANSDGAGDINVTTPNNIAFRNTNAQNGDLNITGNGIIQVLAANTVSAHNININNGATSGNIIIQGNLISIGSTININQNNPASIIDIASSASLSVTGSAPESIISLDSQGQIFIAGQIENNADTSLPGDYFIDIISPVIIFDSSSNPLITANTTTGSEPVSILLETDQIINGTFPFASPIISSEIISSGDGGALEFARYTPGNLAIDNNGIDIDGGGNDLSFENTYLGNANGELYIGDLPGGTNIQTININGRPSNSYGSFNSGLFVFTSDLNSNVADSIIVQNSDFSNSHLILNTPFTSGPVGIFASNNNNFDILSIYTPGTAIIADSVDGFQVTSFDDDGTTYNSRVANLSAATSSGTNGTLDITGNFIRADLVADGTGDIIFTDILNGVEIQNADAQQGNVNIKAYGDLVLPNGSNVQGNNVALINIPNPQDGTTNGIVQIDGNVAANNGKIAVLSAHGDVILEGNARLIANQGSSSDGGIVLVSNNTYSNPMNFDMQNGAIIQANNITGPGAGTLKVGDTTYTTSATVSGPAAGQLAVNSPYTTSQYIAGPTGGIQAANIEVFIQGSSVPPPPPTTTTTTTTSTTTTTTPTAQTADTTAQQIIEETEYFITNDNGDIIYTEDTTGEILIFDDTTGETLSVTESDDNIVQNDLSDTTNDDSINIDQNLDLATTDSANQTDFNTDTDSVTFSTDSDSTETYTATDSSGIDTYTEDSSSTDSTEIASNNTESSDNLGDNTSDASNNDNNVSSDTENSDNSSDNTSDANNNDSNVSSDTENSDDSSDNNNTDNNDNTENSDTNDDSNNNKQNKSSNNSNNKKSNTNKKGSSTSGTKVLKALESSSDDPIATSDTGTMTTIFGICQGTSACKDIDTKENSQMLDQAINLNSQENELDADKQGTAYISQTGYHPAGLEGFLITLERIEKVQAKGINEFGQSVNPVFSKRHPETSKRIGMIDSQLKTDNLLNSKEMRINKKAYKAMLITIK